MRKVLALQDTLLKLVGILPIYPAKVSVLGRPAKYLSAVLFTIAVCLLLGTFFSATFQGVFFLYTLFIASGDPNNHTNPILMGMQFMPFCTLNFRGLIVLFLLFLKRNSWTKLMKTAEVFLETCFPNNQDRIEVMRRARKIAVLLCILTVLIHSAWDVTEWIVFNQTLVNVTMTTGDIVAPLPMAYLIIYGLDFLTMMGYSATVIKNPRTDVDSYIYVIGSIIIFGSYGTVFLLPLVHVYEQSLGLSFSLHHLAIAVKQCLAVADKTDGQSNLNCRAFKGKTVIESVERLETSTNRHICIFHAVELIHYTRGFVVGTCTLLLSFMVLAR
ncbi:hypothetical protein BV898_17326 [Hypsibius exemplaris]|uniref:Uncharacterized protein n=1 Tax=Hypsibius exemplaris TaxID=2072580 RepID=A0A9X6NNE9_HYPEX|nr:hypothetical protein BV898_17326 [Hypsibius exemplaris]